MEVSEIRGGKDLPMKYTLWITGASGQLGRMLASIFIDNECKLVLTDLKKDCDNNIHPLDITSPENIDKFLCQTYPRPDILINCAAITNVDGCETDKESADKVNNLAAGLLAAKSFNFCLPMIQISTDFVFDGEQTNPYLETDQPNPLSVYGTTKRLGEVAVRSQNFFYYILRTAWLYSEFGKNFVKTMLKLSQTKDQIFVVNDQTGSPTYAYDLALAIKEIVDRYFDSKKIPFGTYHFTNSGVATWFDLATEAIKLFGSDTLVVPQSTDDYYIKMNAGKVIVQKPKYSVLNCQKITSVLGHSSRDWQEALAECISKIKSTSLD